MNNKPKHTPGPWHIAEYETKRSDSYRKTVEVRWDANPIRRLVPIITVGWVEVSEPERFKNMEPELAEIRANARLIAAAPELLEALKIAQTFLNRDDIKGTPGLGTAWFEVNKAITKAEGEQK